MKIFFLLLLLFFPAFSISFAQVEPTQKREAGDLRYSVFGPPRPPFWEFQLSFLKEDGQNVSSFNFYKKNQRNKVIFFKMTDNGLNNRNEFRVQEITGGAVLFPINDDDRFQLEIGGTYDKLKDASLYSKAFFSRVTFRPQSNLWFRFGYEYFDGYTSGGRVDPYRNTILNSYYTVGKISTDNFSIMGLYGNGRIDDALNTRFGFAGIFEGPYNFFLLAGLIKSSEAKEDVRTVAIGRSAPFRPDGLPSGMFIWKHKDNYDFQLGGIFWGKTNLFVKPAAIGMGQGMFISSAALRENTELRQGKLMSITDDYRNSDITFFYVYLNQGIQITPGNINHVGFKAVQIIKMFNEIEFSFISNPVLGIFYNELTEPEYNPITRIFDDKEISYISFQVGTTFYDSFILNITNAPSRGEWTLALSFLMK